MAERGNRVRGRRRRDDDGEPATLAAAILRVLVRALGLERAAFLIAERPGLPFVPLATLGTGSLAPLRPGEAPGGGPWSAELTVGGDGGPAGLLLLARADAATLSAPDCALAERLAEAGLRVVEHARVSLDAARSRELLARADRLAALGTLAASLAHEIRNPLVSVRTFIQLLPERLADEEFRTTFRDLALGEVERIVSLINDLLAFSRPAPAELEPSDLNELVGQIVRLLDAEARRHDLALASDADDALPPVVVDVAQVKQVLMNVILNAIQACPPHGRVEITTRSEGRSCVVAVADTGPGIAPEHVGRIFDPFFSTKDAGSGLGLFVAHQIVSQHGGHIAAVPRPGGGTVFSIHFPMQARSRDADAV